MRKLLLTLLSAATLSAVATTKNEAMKIDNSLTQAEKDAGILSAEVMWKMGRVGSSVVSPDGKTVIYTVTRYSMADNKGITNIYKTTPKGGEAVCLGDGTSNESSLSFSADGSKIYFLSDRSGSNQLWSSDLEGRNAQQLTNVEDGIDSYGISADESTMYYTKS
ncbi:MAG: peptidase S9, partial [Rikenellaceae bacterium]